MESWPCVGTDTQLRRLQPVQGEFVCRDGMWLFTTLLNPKSCIKLYRKYILQVLVISVPLLLENDWLDNLAEHLISYMFKQLFDCDCLLMDF